MLASKRGLLAFSSLRSSTSKVCARALLSRRYVLLLHCGILLINRPFSRLCPAARLGSSLPPEFGTGMGSRRRCCARTYTHHGDC